MVGVNERQRIGPQGEEHPVIVIGRDDIRQQRQQQKDDQNEQPEHRQPITAKATGSIPPERALLNAGYRGRKGGRHSGRCSHSSGAPRDADTRVDHRVENIGNEIGQAPEEGDQQYQPHHHGVIPIEDAGDEEFAEAGDAIDHFNEQ